MGIHIILLALGIVIGFIDTGDTLWQQFGQTMDMGGFQLRILLTVAIANCWLAFVSRRLKTSPRLSALWSLAVGIGASVLSSVILLCVMVAVR
jgi:hypothetical protein